MKADIRFVQQMAMAENKDYRIYFDSIKKSYLITKKVGSKFESVDLVSLPEQILELEINDSLSQLNFTKRGTVTKAATITLRTEDYIVKLTIAIATGRVSVYEITKI